MIFFLSFLIFFYWCLKLLMKRQHLLTELKWLCFNDLYLIHYFVTPHLRNPFPNLNEDIFCHLKCAHRLLSCISLRTKYSVMLLGKIFFFFTAISDILNVLYVFQKWISCCSSCISDSCACRDTFELLHQHFYLFSVLMLQNVGVFKNKIGEIVTNLEFNVIICSSLATYLFNHCKTRDFKA